ncbi:MAG: CapA family protein [Myxococcaceae bacterium]
MITLALAGDVMLGRGVTQALRNERDRKRPWNDVLPLLLDSDLRLVNLESPITEYRKPWDRTFKVFHFRADPPVVEFLKAAKIDGVSLANNHALDFGEHGLLDTFRNLDAARIGFAGAGRNLDEAKRPAVFDLAVGKRVALVAYTDNRPEFAAGPDRPGTRFLPVSLEPETLREVEEDLAAAHRRADLVVVSNHWGPNMVPRPSALFRDFAHAVIERGADVYFGHSAHVVQGVELYRNRPIIYDAGDFLDDYAVDPDLRNDYSCLFRAQFDDALDFVALELTPVVLTCAAVRLASGGAHHEITKRLESLSSELGAHLEQRDGRLWLPVSPG